jgi:isocitrate dehydrogenase
VLAATGCNLRIQEVTVGEKAYLQGHLSGIAPESWELLRQSKVFLKAPIATPQGGGFRSVNVTIRNTFGLYANIRPCTAYAPFVRTLHPNMDLVIIRENEEDLYTGVEYRHTDECYYALKIMTRSGSERIIRYAFEYARSNQRKKVTCFTKDNILKLSDGIFHKVYEEVAKEYPDIQSEHWIVDIGAAKLADSPTQFDVIVLPNLYGDILSDIAAQIAGSVGLAGSANIGRKNAMFEALHGSAPRRAGQNLANPSGLLVAAIMMLEYIGDLKSADLIHNAWLKTLEDGLHTYDIFTPQQSREKLGTAEFTNAIIARLGQKAEKLHPTRLAVQPSKAALAMTPTPPKTTKRLVGVDLFITGHENPLSILQKPPQKLPELQLVLVANRGLQLFPGPEVSDAHVSDHWRCRFTGDQVSYETIVSLCEIVTKSGLEISRTENLYYFGDEAGFK